MQLISEIQRVEKLDMIGTSLKSTPEERLADGIVDNLKVIDSCINY